MPTVGTPMARKAAPLLLIPLSLATVAYLLASLVLWSQQGRMVFPAPTAALRPPAGAAVLEGYTERTLQTGDGLRLAFWAAAPRPGKPSVIIFHGNGAAAPSILSVLSPVRQAGYGIVLAEYRGYSGNAGIPSERGFAEDARAYAAWTEAQFGGGLPVVMGESIGTGVAVRLAAEQPVRGLVLDAPFTSVAAVVRAGPFWWAPTILLTSRFDNLSRIGRVTAPVLILHGQADEVVPVRLSHVLAAATSCLQEALYLPGVVHTALRTDPSGRALEALRTFLATLPADGRCPSAAAHHHP